LKPPLEAADIYSTSTPITKVMSETLQISRVAGTNGAPTHVTVTAQALFQILDHALRREEEQSKVIGTLVGIRSEDGSEVEVRNAYAVPHSESEQEMTIDLEYNPTMLALHRKAFPKEVIVGWYATSSELNTFSGLIHDYYTQLDGTPAIHLTVEAANLADTLLPRTYVASAVGIDPSKNSGNCVFVPISNEVKFNDSADRAALEAISSARESPERSINLTSDLANLENSLTQVLDMLERVQTYVARVISGEESSEKAQQVGKQLLSTLTLTPSLDAQNLEALFNSHLQDVLMVVYLANTVKTQLQLSAKLTTLV
jgi:translation initiation factor 3 subunit F